MKSQPGFVYVLSNRAMPGLVKIGCTQKDPRERANDLYATGVPFPFIVEASVRTNDPHGLEARVHQILNSKRVHGRREFFESSVELAVQAINKAAYERGDKVRKKERPETFKNRNRIKDVPLASALVLGALPVPTLSYMGHWQPWVWIAACMSAISLGTPPALKTILGSLGAKPGLSHLIALLLSIYSLTPEGHEFIVEKSVVLSNMLQSYLGISY